MRYLCLYKSEQENSAPPSQDEMTKIGQLIGEMMQAGVLLSTEGCKSSRSGARVKLDAGKFTVTDGERFLSVVGKGISEILEINEQPASR